MHGVEGTPQPNTRPIKSSISRSCFLSCSLSGQGYFKVRWFFVGLLCLALARSSPVSADQGWEGHSIHLIWENDALRGSDRHYTQGAFIRYLSADLREGGFRKLAARLASLGYEANGIKFGLGLGQEIYTPEDLDDPELIPDDRPYAGWLYGSFQLQRRGPASFWGGSVMESLRLDLGVIGPESQAEDTQKVWHGRDPRGWDHQLDTEAGLALRYERTRLFRLVSHSAGMLDLLPGLDISLGNVAVQAGLNATLRLGYNIPDAFEVPLERTRTKSGGYFFGRAGGRFVVHDIFLDGNTWVSSHSVEKNLVFGDVSLGFTLVLKACEITLANHYRTRQFTEQDRADSCGSVTLTWKF